jgi:hypothetical protein
MSDISLLCSVNSTYEDDHIVTCMMVHVTNNYGIRRIIGFITTSVTHAILITINFKQYSAIVHLHFTIHRC